MGDTQVSYQLIMYFGCIFESYLLYYFLKNKFLLYESERIWIKYLAIMGCATLIFAINSLRVPSANLICVPLVLMLFAWLLFRMEFKYNILYVCLFYLTLAVVEFVFYHAYNVFNINPTIVDAKRILILILQNVFRMIVVLMFNKKNDTELMRKKDSYRYLRFLFILPVATIILLNGFIVPEDSPLYFFLVSLGGILIVIANIVEFAIVEKLLKAEQDAKDREMLKQKTELEQTYYLRLKQINRRNAEYIHEINHIIRTIQHLAHVENDDTIQSLVTAVSEKTSSLKNKYYIDDIIAESIFLEREMRAETLGIRYSVNIQPGIDLSFVEDVDKISMFGNLIDNALEAATGMRDGYVLVSLFMKNETFVVFRVENNYKIKPQKQGTKYLTRKQNKEQHGFGLKRVEELKEKYKGAFSMTECENSFTVILMLSNLQISDQ